MAETNALNQTTEYRYDGLNRLVETILPGSLITVNTYDPVGNLVQVTDLNGHTTTYNYDQLDRLTEVTDPLGNTTQYRYDAVGNRTELIDAKGKATLFGYNERNLLVSVTDPLNHITAYEYDANGNMTRITDARGNSTLYEFDPLNRVNKTTDALGRSRTYQYDPNGNKISETDAKGQITGYAYDAMNRLTTVTRPESQTITYTYDKAGNRTSITDPTGTADYTYDAVNRPVRTSYSRNGLDAEYTYDPVGNRTLLTVTRGETVIYSVYYLYNERNQLTGLTDKDGKTFTFSYDNTGNITEVGYPNGTKAVFTYDTANRVTAIDNLKTAGGSLRSYNYTYDPNGRRTQMVTDGSSAAAYEYDDLGQLIRLTDSRGSFDFIYDEAGNRTRMVFNSVYGAVYTDYTYDIANQLLTAGNNTYTYDLNGNRLSKTTVDGTVYYAYDYLNMLTGITTPTGSVTYTYDGDGGKTSRNSTVSGAAYYLFDGDTAILEGNTPDLANPTAYLAGINGLLAKISPQGIIAYYYYDAQGNLGAMADDAGNITDTYAYDAWGAISEQTGGSHEKYTYVGKYGVAIEPDDGLLMMGRRAYDPELGIFLQKDPFPGYQTDPTTLHPYMYTRNDPVNKIDPDGTWWGWNDIKQFAGGVTTAAIASLKGAGRSIANTGADLARRSGEVLSSGARKIQKGIATAGAKLEKKKERIVQRGKAAGTVLKEKAVQALNTKTGRMAVAGLQTAGGVASVAAGGLVTTAAGWTGVGAVAGAALIAHGVNDIMSGGADLYYAGSDQMNKLGTVNPLKDIFYEPVFGQYADTAYMAGGLGAGLFGGFASNAAKVAKTIQAADKATDLAGGASKAAKLTQGTGEAATQMAKPSELWGRQLKQEFSGSQIKRIKKDMTNNGYTGEPIEVFEVNGRNVILDGHHRARAAGSAGLEQVPIRKLTEAELKNKWGLTPNELENQAIDAASQQGRRWK